MTQAEVLRERVESLESLRQMMEENFGHFGPECVNVAVDTCWRFGSCPFGLTLEDQNGSVVRFGYNEGQEERARERAHELMRELQARFKEDMEAAATWMRAAKEVT